MVRAFRQGAQHPAVGVRHVGRHFQDAASQRACLVKDDRVDSGEPLQSGFGLYKKAVPVEPGRCHDGNCRHGEAQRARTGDDERCDGDVQGHAHVAGSKKPAEKRSGCNNVDGRGIDRCRTVSEAGIAGSGILCRGDKPCHAAEGRVLANRSGRSRHWTAEHDVARHQGVATGQGQGIAFAGDGAPVDLDAAFVQNCVNRYACAGRKPQRVTDTEIPKRTAPLNTVLDPEGASGLDCDKIGGGRASGAAHSLVENAASQQEERECECCVKPGVLSAIRDFIERHGRRQDDGKGDRDVDVETADTEGRPSVPEERLGGVDRRGKGNCRADPVQEVTSRIRCT